MICEKCLKAELKRCPKLIKDALKDQDLGSWMEMIAYQGTLEWVLSEDDCAK